MAAGAPDLPEKLLTPRQLEVLELMAKGLTNKDIGRVLGIASGTAKLHVSAVIEALDVTNRTEAATRLHELGLGAGETRPEFTVPDFGARPAIAVLPFDNFSNDTAQDFLADGIVEDLITRLSRWRWFPVIARNSTFVYKGRAVEVKEVSRALGARYVVEGSVRGAGDRVRVTVQLLDGETAQHLWAECYDRELAEVFEVEDEIVDSLVATLEPALLKLSGLRVASRNPEQLDAWESIQRGFLHAASNTAEGFERARACFERAAQLEPGLSTAHSFSAYCQFQLLMLDHPQGSLDALTTDADAARALDPSDPMAHAAVAVARWLGGEIEAAFAAFARAVELGPSLAWAHVARGIALGLNGRPEEGLAAAERALRLSPHDPLLYFTHLSLGVCRLGLARFEEATADFQTCLREGPALPHAYPFLAGSLVVRGELNEARAVLSRMRAVAPGYRPMAALRRLTGSEELLAAAAAALAAAGWTEPAEG